MTVFFDKSRRRWRYDFRAGGVRHAGYCLDGKGDHAANKTEAIKIEVAVRAKALADRKKADKSHKSYTFAQALAAYAAQVRGRKNWRNNVIQISELLSFFGGETPVTQITEARVWEYIAWSRRQPVRVWVGGAGHADQACDRATHKALPRLRSDARINRYLAVLKKALGIASRQADPATGLPVLPVPPRIETLKEVERLPNPVPVETVHLILQHLPQLVADVVTLLVLTGTRKGELLARRVEDYRSDLGALRIPGAETKGGRDEYIPIPEDAAEVIKRRVEASKEAGSVWLFPSSTGTGHLKDFKRSWATALRRAGAPHYRIHDLKATFVTTVARVDRGMAQTMARHRSEVTTKRYIAVLDSRRHATAAAVGRILSDPAGVPHNNPTRESVRDSLKVIKS